MSTTAPPNPATLTPRERQIVTLVANGAANKTVAAALAISKKTVEAHTANVMRKLGTRNRAQLCLWAHRAGLVTA